MDEVTGIWSYEQLKAFANDTEAREEMVIFIEDLDGVREGRLLPGMPIPEGKSYNYPGGVDFSAIDYDGEVYDGDFYMMTTSGGTKPHVLGWRAWNRMPSMEQRKKAEWKETKRE